MNVIDFEVGCARTDGASPALLFVQRLDVVSREGAARGFFASTSDALVNLVECADSFWIAALPFIYMCRRLLRVLCTCSSRVSLRLLGVSSRVIFLMLVRICSAPLTLLLSVLLWVVRCPSAGLRILNLNEARICIAPRKILSVEFSATLHASAYAGKALGYMLVLARLAGEVPLQSLLNRFSARDGFHFRPSSMAQGAVA